MKITPLLLSCIVVFSACNRSSENATPDPTNTQTKAKKLFVVTVGGKAGYIDRAGKLVVNPQYDQAADFSEGLALVCVGQCDQEHWQGYRYTKSWETEPIEQTFKYGYIDETGKMVINPMFEAAESFSEGLAGVCVGHGCYYSSPSDKLKKEKEEEKWGYIDKTGTIVIPPQFKYARGFHDGLAVVCVGDKYGYIDKTGKFVINPQFDSAMEFDNGVASVMMKVADKYQSGYIDQSGKYIWPPSN
jgi:hypothetical protein